MKLFLNNTSVVFQRSLTKTVMTAATFSGNITAGKFLNGQTGAVRDLAAGSAVEPMQDLPANTKLIKIFNTGYAIVDGYAPFALYDSDGNFLVAGSSGTNKELDLNDYPTAAKYRVAWMTANQSIVHFDFYTL